MNAGTAQAFQRLKPYCVALSLVSLQDPNSARSQIHDLRKVISAIKPDVVTRNLANYIFFPVKALIKADIHEAILEDVFCIIGWLMQTEWFEPGPEMTSQLVMLHSTFFAKAKSEELKLSILGSLSALSNVGQGDINTLKLRPTLAHLFIVLLEECASISTQLSALKTLYCLCNQMDGDTAASFLPGCISSLSRILVKVNQRSSLLEAGANLMRLHIYRSIIGEETDYRTDSWKTATTLQLMLALPPILSQLIKSDYPAVAEACITFCVTMLDTCLPPSIFVEYLMQIDANSIPARHEATIASVLEMYVDASTRILKGVDEDRKMNMLKTLGVTLPRVSVTSRKIISSQIISQALELIEFEAGSSKIVPLAIDDDILEEPRIKYFSDEVRDGYCTLLSICFQHTDIPLDTPEHFWIAQKVGLQTYAHALQNLSLTPVLSQQAIVAEARSRGKAFRAEMMSVLYPLLAQPQPSLYALQEIAKACEYEGVEQMIISNADYVVNSLSLAFMTLDITPRTPRVLGILVQLAPTMVELIDDVVETIFDVLDSYHGYLGIVEGIFNAMAGVVKAAMKQEVPSSFVEGLAQIEQPSQVNSWNDSIPAEEMKVETITKTFQIVLLIVQKAQIFLSHAEPQIRLNVLMLLYDALPILATNENKFLPTIHLYWPQLTRRLEDSNPFVVALVLQVIARTITYGASFMRMRINDDVLPAIKGILHPAKDKRGNLLGPQRQWEGTGRRKVAEGIQHSLKSIIEDGGLQSKERTAVLALIEELSAQSETMRLVLEQARLSDAAFPAESPP